MNVLGEGFHPSILGQIAARQKIFATGYNPNNPRTPQAISYAAGNSSFLKLMSSVSLNDLDILNNPTVKTLGLKGNELAKKAVLFGGVKESGGQLQGGILNTNSNSIFNSFAYGWGGTEYGLRAMPGLLSATVKSESIGSLKTATINIKAWNRTQFEIIDTLYLRLGFYVLLEWGHTIYVNNEGIVQTNPESLEDNFFNRDPNVDSLQSLIIEKRHSSCGNFDAMLGRVVNFNWTFEADGSYNITVIVRSIGDVIESLKTNVLTVDPVNLPETLQEAATGKTYLPGSEPIKNPFEPTKTSTTSKVDSSSTPYPNNSNIHARFNKLKNLIDNTNSAVLITYLSEYKLKDIYKVDWNGKNDGPSYYIRFGAFLKVIENDVIPLIYKGSTPYKLIKIDTDVESNLVNFLDAQVSTDPSKILIKRYFEIDKEDIKILPGAEEYITNINDISYGQLMNIYINFDYIIALLEESKNLTSNKVILIDFLKKIGLTIGSSLGSINNIVPTIDEDINTIKFIDQNQLMNKTSLLANLANKKYNVNTKPGKFDLYGYNPQNSGSAGFIKEFTLKTELTPQFASMITIAASARSKAVGEDATALSRLNAGLTSSLFETYSDSYLDANTSPTLEEQFPTALVDYYNFIKGMSMSPNKPKWNNGDFSIYTSTLNSFITYTQQLSYSKTHLPNTSTGFIPINVSLTMRGMSGMKIYQEFSLDTNYLPSNYDREMSFLIRSVTHTIQNNSWDTNIESLSLPKTVTKPLSFSLRINDILSKPDTNGTTIIKIPSIEATPEELDKYYKTILANLGAPSTLGNMLFLKAWRQAEGGQAIWNGFNTTLPKPGSTNYNSAKVKNYLSLTDGASAISDTIKNKKYANLLRALKAGIKDQKAAEKLALELQQPHKDLWIWVNGPNSYNPALSGYVAGILKYTVRNSPIYKPKI